MEPKAHGFFGRLSLIAFALMASGCEPFGNRSAKNEETAGIGSVAAMSHYVLRPASVEAPPAGVPSIVPQRAGAAASAAFGFKPMSFLQRPDGYTANYQTVAVGDFNDDGRDDVVAYAASEIDVWQQTPNGALKLAHTFSTGTTYSQISELETGDFNEDGIVDAAVSSISPNGAQGGVHMLSYRRGAGFQFEQAFPYNEDGALRSAFSWTVLDADADGHLDIVGAWHIRDDFQEECGAGDCPRLKIMYGNGRGKFDRSGEIMLKVPYRVAELEAEDLNDDGAKDLVMVLANDAFEHYEDPADVKVAFRKPAGGFAAFKRIHGAYAGNVGGNVVFADLNSDGLRDSITFTGGYPQVRYRRLDGTFAPALYLYSSSSYPAMGLVADLDGDKRADVMTMQVMFDSQFPYTAMGVYLQKDASLQAPWYYTLGLYEVYYASSARRVFAIGDLNGDGCRDAVAVTSSNNGILVLKGENCLHTFPSCLDESGYVWRQ